MHACVSLQDLRSFDRSGAWLAFGVLLQLLAQVLPIVNHQLLNGKEGFVAHIRVIVSQQLHHELFTVELFDDAANKHTTTQGIDQVQGRLNKERAITYCFPRGK